MRSSPKFALLCATLLCTLPAFAQLPGLQPVLTPNGSAVFEARFGTQPANRGLIFLAVITAGPVSGSTSVLLMQSPVAALFTPGNPPPGWTTVRSSISAYSLGGGCGRNNQIDFPYINGTRPEILRITGTTQQVVTLGITNTDQYDSIDCVVQGNGQVLYMLTNRTRQRLELRREQGGLLQLVRDDFGTVRTPFQGGIRPAIALSRFRPPPGPVAPMGGPPPFGVAYDLIVAEETVISSSQVRAILRMLDDGVANMPTASECVLGVRPDPLVFGNVNESALAGNLVAADFTGSGFFGARRLGFTTPTCDVLGSDPLSGRLGGTLFSFSGVAAAAWPGGPGPNPIPIVAAVDNDQISFWVPAAGVRRVRPLPGAGRGGYKALCELVGPGTTGGVLLATPAAAASQILLGTFAPPVAAGDELIFGDHLEAVFDAFQLACTRGAALSPFAF